MENLPIVALIGPTGIGKTKLGVALAKAFNGEVVSIDSIQVYQVGDIMTAKPTKEEMNGVVHHMIDYIAADQEPENFVELAVQRVEAIHENKKLPILVGGSISLTKPVLFHRYMQQVNLSVIILHSKMSVLGIRMDARIADMESQGLYEEVALLYKLERELLAGPDFSKGIWKSIGYRELRPVMECKNHAHACLCWLEGLAKMQESTRTYAKNQMISIWTDILPSIQGLDLNFAILTVRGPSFFDEQVIEPAIRECSVWLSQKAGKGLATNGTM